MYSPRISEDLIPLIYKKAKEKKAPMTKIVDEILRATFYKEEKQHKQLTNNGEK